MKELLKTTQDFKIIPSNFKSSGVFNFIEVTDNEIIGEVAGVLQEELCDYMPNSGVEIFGVNEVGLVYFETKIIKREENKISLALTSDYSVIQRREYSRVGLGQGKISFNDMRDDLVLKIEDISAGGVKLICREPLVVDKFYDIQIILSNNMNIKCALAPIRVGEVEYENQKAYVASGKFVDLENADRIVLVQYAFKIKMEEKSKENY